MRNNVGARFSATMGVMKKVALILILVILAGAGFYFFGRGKALAPVLNSIQKSESGEVIPVVIVPHFDTFSAKRGELLKYVGGLYRPETTIVVSVDHYNSGPSDITTADKTWKLNGGNVSSASNLVKKLSDSGIAGNDEAAFNNEHGITNVLPDVRDNLSGKVLPIIIKDTTKREAVDKLAGWINSNCNDCILVASTDFSHYQPNSLAKIHDSYSIQALNNLDADKTWAAETDSPQTLYLAEQIAKSAKTENFHLFYNSNSGELNSSDDVETTSVVLGYYSDKAATDAVAPSTSFVIAGDAMFDRSVWAGFKTVGLKKIFDNFGTRVFRGVDMPVINLEGPISPVTIPGIKSGSMSFNFQPEVPDVLKYLNVGAVSLANNHTNNAGTSGFASTKKLLTNSGVKYFGLPESFNATTSLLRFDGPVPTTIIGIMTLSDYDEAAMEATIKSEKSAGRTVIICPHWGTEYEAKHSIAQERAAKAWTSAGADLVIGSHPHVTEDFEVVNGKPVIYSLGNFVFDQFFSEETQQGLVVAGTISSDKITLTFLPTIEHSVKPQFMTGAAKTDKLQTVLNINSGIGFTKISSDTIEITRK